MLSIHEKIRRAERLLERLEGDRPLLNVRVAPLGREQQESSKNFLAAVIAEAEAELHKLRERQASELDVPFPAPAD